MIQHTAKLTALWLGFALVIGGLPGCDRLHNYSEQELIQRAKDFQDKGKIKSAIIELKNLLQKAPNNAEARLLLGQAYITVGQGNSAEKELTRAVKLGVNEETVKVFLGQALLLQQNYGRVLKEINAGPQTSPKNAARIQQLQGDAYLGLGQWEQGCAQYKQAVQAAPDHVPTYWGLVRCAAAAKDVNQVRAYIDQALKLNPKNAITWVLLGDFEGANNNSKAAEAAYVNALKAEPENIDAHLSFASFYLTEKKFEEAEKEVKAARKVAPSHVMVRYMQALVDFRQGKFPEARDNLQEILRQAPEHAPSLILSGAVAYALGSNEQAEQLTTKFLGLYPNNNYARKLRVAILLKKGDVARAQAFLKPLLSQADADAHLLSLAGEASLASDDFERAGEYLEKAVSISPQDASLRTQLGVAYLAKGETTRAIAELESVAANNPSVYKADLVLIKAYLEKGEWDKALEATVQLERKFPNNPLVYNLRGAAYVGKKDIANARKSYEKAQEIHPTYFAAALNLAKLDGSEKNLPAARQRFEKILAKDKGNLQAMLALAEYSNDEKEAVSWLERASKANPKSLQPRKLLLNYYLKTNRSDKALSTAHEALDTNPDHPESLDMLGKAQFGAGKPNDALATYSKLAAMVPQSYLAHFKLASVQASVKNVVAAKKSLNTALELKPDYTEAQMALIGLEMQSGNPEGALLVARRIQKQFPGAPAGLVMEGDILSDQKKYAEAAIAFEKAFAISKDSMLVVKVHQAKSKVMGTEKADVDLVKWLTAHPDDYVVRGYLAQTYLKAGKYEKSIEQYQYIQRKSPNNPQLLNDLAWMYHQMKDKRALATAERALSLKPGDPLISDTLGWILVEQGEVRRGLDLLQKAVAGSPSSPDIGYHFAVALAKTGEKDKARKQLEGVLATGKDFPEKEKAQALLKQL